MVTLIRVIFFLLLIPILSSAQTITSKVTGGAWGAASTWEGGIVPSSGSDVVIAGNVIYQNGDGTCRNLSINAGASLYNQTGYAWGEQILTVTGNVTNNGTIRSASNLFVMKIKGNIINNGTWTFKRTELTGNGTQTLSTTNNSKFENYILVDAVSKPTIIAGSNLIFTTTFDLSKSTFDAKNFSITLNGDAANITNGKVLNTGLLTGTPTLNTSYCPIINDITYDGNTNIKGRLRINSSVVMSGSVTVTDTLENSTGYAHPEKKLQVNGNFSNNGIIRNGGGAGFALNITGNITNTGKWIHNRTELSGSSNQTLSLGAGKVFESAFKVTDQTGQIVAGSELVFTGGFDLNKCVLDQKNYALYLKGEGANISNGTVINTMDLIGKSVKDNAGNPFYPILDNITYDGSINLKGIFKINSSVTLRGNITVVDTIQNSTGYAHPEKILKIIGSLTNNGLVRDGGSAGFVLDVTGNITANKKNLNKRIQLSGSGVRNISGANIQGAIEVTGTNVLLSGRNILPYLTVNSGAYCELAGGGTLTILEGNVSGRLVNKGEIIIARKTSTAGDYSYFSTNAKLASVTGLDSLRVRHFGYTVPASFSNALKAYWRFEPRPTASTITIDQLTLYYDNAQLGSNNEATLQVFQSTDGAKTWKQVSTPQSITRDTVNNFVRINNASVAGDYVLSSSGNPLTVIPSVVVSIIGRSQIRVGPPNRYTINYVNNGDVPTEDFLLAINTGTNVHILQTEHVWADGKREIVPADSLFYDKEDTTLVMYVAGLAPREERTFDLVATADRIGLPKTTNAKFIDPASITVATVTLWAAKAALVYVAVKAIDYVGSKAKEKTALTPEQKKQWEERYTKIPDEIKTKESKKEWAAKKIGTKIIEKGMGIVGGGVDLVRAVGRNIWELGPNLRRRFFSNNSNNSVEAADEIMEDGKAFKPEISGKNIKTTQRVTSWDPNEKIGPTGFGAKKFLTSAGKMTYQILFENKKEASAPAYKIVILDTLQSMFNPETVEFGKKSHEGNQYNWVITRNGNILKWEIEGIELPPNKVPPEGEGYVNFSVSTKSNLLSGTEIKNKATITFDINKPIQTNEYINKLDFTAPATIMNASVAMNKEKKMVVTWKSNDGTDGSGVESSSVFMSVDQGAYEMIGVSFKDTLVVNPISGTHSYSFYALTKDNVGNVEAVRPTVVSATVTSSVEKIDETLPEEYSLAQNYPNPFNPNTVIQFALPKKSNVLLEVFNVLGQRLEVLLNQELSPSNYKIEFNGSRFASGIYLYRIIADGFTQTRKMLLIK